MTKFHPEKGELTKKGRKFNPLTNKVEDVYVDKTGKEHKLDGTERPTKELDDIVAEIKNTSKRKREIKKGNMEMAKNRLDSYLKKRKEKKTEKDDKEKKHSELKEVLEKIPEAIEKKEVKSEIKVNNLKSELSDVVQKLKIELQALKTEEVDLTPIESKLDLIASKIKSPEKQKFTDYTSLLKDIKKSLPDNVDTSKIESLLKDIKERPQFEIPEKLIKNDRIKVEVDRISMGGAGGATGTGLATSDNQTDGSQKTQIVDGGGDVADVIDTNGSNGLVTISPGHVSTDNSTADTLSADATYTGDWEDITNFGIIVVTLNASHASATDGLEIDFSSDGTNIDSTDNFTIPATTGKTFSFQTASQYFRVKYTNGGDDQTYFRLQTILKPYYVKPSSHRIQDSIIDDDDGELNLSVLKLRTAADNYVSGAATSAGNFKVSVEEYESDANPIRSDLEGNGYVTIGTSEVELTFTGETHHVHLESKTTNTGTIWIGKTGITNTGGNAYASLQPGESIDIPYNDSDNALYAISDTADQSLLKGALL